METRIEWCERTLPMMLDALEDELPLRYRELCLSGYPSFPVGVQINVCDRGHVHVQIGPHSPMHLEMLYGLYGYTLAKILDTKPTTPKRPGKAVVESTINSVYDIISHIDVGLAEVYSAHVELLFTMLNQYVEAATGKPLVKSTEASRSPLRVPVGEEVVQRQEELQPPPEAMERARFMGINLFSGTRADRGVA